ncbi:MAG: hypothetical protein M1827_006292 [Pycnora praestabilis]|nr:MAG: hypothetical protein M1827_006292 [Pycnora praestabilis]
MPLCSEDTNTFFNPFARSWTATGSIHPGIEGFHQRLPDYAVTPLISLDSEAQKNNVGHVFLKDESNRFGLPSYKILGASWGAYCAVTRRLNLSLESSLEEVRIATKGRSIRLYTATDGNYGRALARVAKYMGVEAQILVPENMDQATQDRIASEGATVTIVAGDYDLASKEAAKTAKEHDGLLIQDTAWPGYEEIPQCIVEGYSTMLREVDRQVEEITGKPVDLVVMPVGVGSFAQAVVAHFKSPGRSSSTLAVEPDTAACLKTSLETNGIVSIPTGNSIMCGMNCGTVSSIAWPFLRDGLDASTVISDGEAHDAVKYLETLGISAGPCGAATLVAFNKLGHLDHVSLGIRADSTVVLLCTEGARGYEAPSE